MADKTCQPNAGPPVSASPVLRILEYPEAHGVGQDFLTLPRCAIDDALLKNLAGFRSEGKILPFPTMTVRRVVLDGCAVAVIEVEPSDNPPVRCDGRVWIRVGPRRAIATAEEERRLIENRRGGNLPYDAHGVRGANLDDLDLRRFQLEYLPVAVSPEALAQNQRTQDDQLRALRLVGADGAPTVTALLIIGVEPRRWIPGAYVQFLRLDGTQLTDPIQDHREITGTLADQLRLVDEVVRANIRRSVTVGGTLREEAADYPEEAL